MNLSNTLQEISSHPIFRERALESIESLDENREPCFFTCRTEDELSFSPVYQGGDRTIEAPLNHLINYLFPDLSEADIARIENGNGTQAELIRTEAAFRTFVAMTHFQFREILLPSEEDLALTNTLYEMYTNSGNPPPIQIIGRVNEGIDLLAIEQIRAITSDQFNDLWIRLERNIIAIELPRYMRENSVEETDIETVIKNLAELAKLSPQEWLETVKGIADQYPRQDIVEKFRKEFRAEDLTHWKSYLDAVTSAIEELGAYRTATIRINFGWGGRARTFE